MTARTRIDETSSFLQPPTRLPDSNSERGPQCMSDDIQITPLSRSPRDISRFLNISYRIYEGDPLWVAPLLMDLKKVFTDANPLFDHAKMQLWVATRNGQDVGRIAGIVDEHHNRTAKEPAAF